LKRVFPPVALSLVLLAACTSRSGSSDISSEEKRGFSVAETEYATVLYESGVDEANVREIGQMFEVGYRVVAEDLGDANRRPRLYVYLSEQRMYQDLIGRWGYSEWVRRVHTIPRMHRDYIEWIPPQHYHDIAFVTHEYSHRIIEQIAGLNSQVNFKWFDEGLAECEGQRALQLWSPTEAAWRKAASRGSVVAALRSHSLARLGDITTEAQWSAQMEHGGQSAYAEAWAAMDYLVGQHGIANVKAVLKQVGTGKSFRSAFQDTYGFTIEAFETSFRLTLPFAAAGP
jgi:hypothetical protein